MSIVIDLKKKLDIQLEKKGIREDLITRVGFLLDTSGSMEDVYESGHMNKLNERLLPIALRFDDNRSMEVFGFSTTAHRLPDMTEENYKGYVKSYILPKFSSLSGMTHYSRGLNAFRKEWSNDPNKGLVASFLNGLLGTKESTEIEKAPGFIILQTDGCNQDFDETVESISTLQKENIFVCMIGTGNGVSMSYLSQYENQSPNVSVFKIDDLKDFSDDELYENILSHKAVTWLKSL